MIDTIASHILALPAWVALLLVFALPALESSAFVGFVFPGEIALILGGVLAYEGKVSFAAVLAAGIGGAVVGDSVGYLIGRRYGRGVLEGTLGRFVNHRHFDRAERYLAERGGRAVFFGRFTAALRVMIPGLAGMSRMHYPKFARYNVAGGVAWGGMCVVLGYLGGSSWRHVAHLASRIGLATLVAVVLLLALGYLVRRTHSTWARQALARLRGSRAATRFVQRFPRQSAWLSARFDPSLRTGLGLTTVSTLLVISTWLFLGVTQDVVDRDGLALADPRAHAWVLEHRTSWLDQLMRAVTWLGSSAVLVPVLVLAAAALGRSSRSWRPVRAVVVVYGAAVFVHAVVAELVRRPRPAVHDWLASAGGWSYPSGHTMQATAAWGLLLVLLAAGRSPRAKALLALAATLVVVLVAASRVYLGVHWLSDVLGAVSLSVALLSLWEAVRRVGASDVARPRDGTGEVDLADERRVIWGSSRVPRVET